MQTNNCSVVYYVVFIVAVLFLCQVISKPVDKAKNNDTNAEVPLPVKLNEIHNLAENKLQFHGKNSSSNDVLDKKSNVNVSQREDEIIRSTVKKSYEQQQTQKVHVNPEDLKPPDHLEGLKLERDGHINKNYHKEAMFGNGVPINADDPEIVQTRILTDIFYKMDTDKSEQVSLQELEVWIRDRVKEHMNDAIEENKDLFFAVDANRDGFATWDEYHVHFLVNQGMHEQHAKIHQKAHDDFQRGHRVQPKDDFDEQLRDVIAQDNFRWSEADENQDEKLSVQEFLGFRHPEHSRLMLHSMVRDILHSLDKDNDGQLTAEEFSVLSPGDVDSNLQEEEKEYQEERKKEFSEQIDLDRNGIATFEELMGYTNPRNPLHAKNEAYNLFRYADTDENGQLSLREVLEMRDLFLGSNIANPAQAFHDEF